MGKITLNEVVDMFLKEKNIDEELKGALSDKIIQDIKEEIIEENVEYIKAESKKRKDLEERTETFNKIRNLIIETLIIGLVSGLLINQITELIGIWKGGSQVELITWFWTLGLSGTLFIMVFLMFLNKVSDLIIKKK